MQKKFCPYERFFKIRLILRSVVPLQEVGKTTTFVNLNQALSGKDAMAIPNNVFDNRDVDNRNRYQYRCVSPISCFEEMEYVKKLTELRKFMEDNTVTVSKKYKDYATIATISIIGAATNERSLTRYHSSADRRFVLIHLPNARIVDDLECLLNEIGKQYSTEAENYYYQMWAEQSERYFPDSQGAGSMRKKRE